MPVAIAAVPAAIGAFQFIKGLFDAKKAKNSLLNQQTPTVAPNKAINDYYQAAMNRWAAGPYNSIGYQVNKRGILEQGATAQAGTTSRRMGVQTAGAIQQMSSNNLMRAGAQAEKEGNIAFGQYGNAAKAKYANDQYTFGINSMLPYNKNREVYAAELGGANMLENAGIQSIESGFNNAASIGYANTMAGKNFWTGK